MKKMPAFAFIAGVSIFCLCGTASAAIDLCAGKTGKELEACRKKLTASGMPGANVMTADAMMNQQQQMNEQAALNVMSQRAKSQTPVSAGFHNQVKQTTKNMKR